MPSTCSSAWTLTLFQKLLTQNWLGNVMLQSNRDLQQRKRGRGSKRPSVPSNSNNNNNNKETDSRNSQEARPETTSTVSTKFNNNSSSSSKLLSSKPTEANRDLTLIQEGNKFNLSSSNFSHNNNNSSSQGNNSNFSKDSFSNSLSSLNS